MTPSPLWLILQRMERLPSPQDSYPGGKAGAGVYQKLINLMPLHTVYIEPFLGHGAVLLRKRPARLNIGVDLYDQAVQKVRTRLEHRQSSDSCTTSVSGDDAAEAIRTHRQSEYICSVYASDDDAGLDAIGDDTAADTLRTHRQNVARCNFIRTWR